MPAWAWVLIAVGSTFVASYVVTRIVQIRALRRDFGTDEERVVDLSAMASFDMPSRVVTIEELEAVESGEEIGRAS